MFESNLLSHHVIADAREHCYLIVRMCWQWTYRVPRVLDAWMTLIADPPKQSSGLLISSFNSREFCFGEIADEGDGLVERRPARADVIHRHILVSDRHAAEQDGLVRRRHGLRDSLANLRPRRLRAPVQSLGAQQQHHRFEIAVDNSAPAVVIYSGGDHLEGVFVFEIIDGQITNLYAMRNPDQLAGISIPRAISISLPWGAPCASQATWRTREAPPATARPPISSRHLFVLRCRPEVLGSPLWP